MDELFDPWGLVVVARHPEHRDRIFRAATTGDLVRVLPGVYRRANEPETVHHRVGAVLARSPRAVFTHETAAGLSWWPGLLSPQVSATGVAARADWLTTSRRVVPDAWVVTRRRLSDGRRLPSGIRLTHPALTALDLTESLGGEALDECLRGSRATLDELRRALAAEPGRPGRLAKRRLLEESRDEPWSAMEREGHRRLHAAGITGWIANHAIWHGQERYVIDVAFRGARIAVELDSWTHHQSRQAFVVDRVKQNALALEGWTLLRFTWGTLDDLVPQVTRLLKRRGGSSGVARS
ncbi:DUF559 domain-containing protein [Aestuariimicrobium soli]|uniref:DUF559 domain-containing protein n=1 Tax=Aestuariimicrobium soli TaxID=2035834 RepID=UPI003EBC9614